MNDDTNTGLFPYIYRAVRWKAQKLFTVVCSDGRRVPAALKDYGQEGLGADLATPLELGQVVGLVFSNLDEHGAARFEAQVVRIEGRRHGFIFCGPQEPFLMLKAFTPAFKRQA